MEKAEQILLWYRLRWTIEEFFRATKKKGLQTESSQIEHVGSLKNLLAISFLVAIRCLQFVRVRDGGEKSTIPAQIAFTEEDIIFSEALCKQYEGSTEKQKNPYPINSLSRLAWVIARAGGWYYVKGGRPPGVITFSKGLAIFYQLTYGWKIALGLR